MELLSKSAAKDNPYFLIGKIVKAHGLKGGLKVKSLSDFPERFFELDDVWLSHDADIKNPRKARVRQVQELSPGFFLCYLEGTQYRDQSEALVGSFFCLPQSEAYELPEDMFYASDLLEYQVYHVNGEHLGSVTQVIQSHQDLIEFADHQGKTHWIPFVRELVPEVNTETQQLIIDPIEGLLEL